jgi:hypothetical protein
MIIKVIFYDSLGLHKRYDVIKDTLWEAIKEIAGEETVVSWDAYFNSLDKELESLINKHEDGDIVVGVWRGTSQGAGCIDFIRTKNQRHYDPPNVIFFNCW